MKDNPGWTEQLDAFARPSNRCLLLFCGHEKISRTHEITTLNTNERYSRVFLLASRDNNFVGDVVTLRKRKREKILFDSVRPASSPLDTVYKK